MIEVQEGKILKPEPKHKLSGPDLFLWVFVALIAGYLLGKLSRGTAPADRREKLRVVEGPSSRGRPGRDL